LDSEEHPLAEKEKEKENSVISRSESKLFMLFSISELNHDISMILSWPKYLMMIYLFACSDGGKCDSEPE